MFFNKNTKTFQFFESDNTVAVSKENWEEIELRRQGAKKYALFYNETDEKVEISVAPSIFHEWSGSAWVYNANLELLSTKNASVDVLKQLDEIYRKKKDGAFAVDFTDFIKNLNVPGKTDILFPTAQPAANLTIVKKIFSQNENIVDYATNKIKYKDHDRCVLWVQDSRDIQSLVSLGHTLAADWSSKNSNSSIFDYIHYQQVGIAGIQYNATQIRTAQPNGYPVVLDKHSLRMWIFILGKINEKKEQLHGRYLLLKTQIQNCTKMSDFESVVKNMNTGWVEVFSDTETPTGMTVIR